MKKDFSPTPIFPAAPEIRVFGDDLAELFINAAKALGAGKNEREKGDGLDELLADRWEEVSLTAENKEALLARWLNEITELSKTKKKSYSQFLMIEFSEKGLRAKIAGREDRGKEGSERTVSFEGLTIRKEKGHWQADIRG